MVLEIRGPNCKQLFQNESGVHEWQRVPPTERNSRVHTSTISVAVVETIQPKKVHVAEQDLEWKYTRSSGNGGQKANKCSSCVILTHKPTKIVIRCEQERSQHRNKQLALEWLKEKLQSAQNQSGQQAVNQSRIGQITGVFRRTVSVKRNEVKDHVSGAKIAFQTYENGRFPGIWQKEQVEPKEDVDTTQPAQ